MKRKSLFKEIQPMSTQELMQLSRDLKKMMKKMTFSSKLAKLQTLLLEHEQHLGK